MGRARGGGPGLRFGFRNAMFPSLVSLEVAAKSFVLPRWSNFIFSRPHKLFRRAVVAGCWFFGAIQAPIRYPAAHSTSRIIGVLVRTVLQLGFAVQSSGKKRCGRRVVELRRRRARLHSLRKNSGFVSGPDAHTSGKNETRSLPTYRNQHGTRYQSTTKRVF